MAETVGPPSDQPIRDRIRSRLRETQFVEAGAGTGKTTALVDRVVSLIVQGEAAVDRLAVITFTRAAASELRERVRGNLEAALRGPGLSEEDRARLQSAVSEVDYATIQTIDGFALSLLREEPLGAGLPPIVEPMDEVEAVLQFDDHWASWLDEALEDPALLHWIDRATRLGLTTPLENLKRLAKELHENYHLLPGDPDFRDPFDGPRVAADCLINAGPQLRELAKHCTDDSDRMYRHLQSLFPYLEELIESDGDESLSLLDEMPKLSKRLGDRTRWRDTVDGVKAHRVIQEKLSQLQGLVDDELSALRAEALGELATRVARFVQEYAGTRRTRGRAEFRDLLVWARGLLTQPEIRRRFQRRYSHVLIDEFQDTDPLQMELAVLLTSAPDATRPRPGTLFVVGDPKQSIYGWRGADLSSLQACRKTITDGRDPLYLTRSFRAHQGLLAWVNAVFRPWFDAESSGEQARYVELEAERELPDDGWGAFYIGEAADDASMEEIREREAQEIARLCRQVGAGKWMVQDAEGGLRASTYRDVAILLRTRGSLSVLEWALEQAEAPFILSGESLVYATQDVRDLMAALTAIDDPSDEVAIVAALRSPAYGCSDVELSRWRGAGGPFDYTRPWDEHAEIQASRVAEALRHMRTMHASRMRESTPGLAERFIRERRMREAALDGRRPRERWDRLAMIVENARMLTEAGLPSLRHLISWVTDRASSRTRVAESAGLAPPDDSVRVMTVHAAKGLEFPIVVIAGIHSERSGSRHAPVVFDHGGPGRSGPAGIGFRLGTREREFKTGDYEGISAAKARAGIAEEARLMYVACTRARDHLVVSLHRKARDTQSLAAQFARYGEHAAGLWRGLSPVAGEPAAIRPSAPRPDARDGHDVTDSLEARGRWIARRDEALERASRPTAVSATSLRPGAAAVSRVGRLLAETEAPGRELEPWRRGRAASAVGRALHAVLQDVDLSHSREVGALAERHASAHGIASEAERIRELAEATLRTPLMHRAAEAFDAGRCWREVYVASSVTRGLSLEGYVDLVFQEGDGQLVIVDYKTDDLPLEETLEAGATPYELQLGAYAAATVSATGVDVCEAWILFSRRAAAGQPAEHRVRNLGEAMVEAKRAAAEATRGG